MNEEPESVDVKIWYTSQGGKSDGPFSEEELIQFVFDGELERHTPIWRPDEESDWKALEKRIDIDGELPPPLPSVADSLENTSKSYHTIPPHPWRRYFARLIDSFVSAVSVFPLCSIIFFGLAPETAYSFFEKLDSSESRYLNIFAATIVAVFFNAPLIGLVATTPGKFLFGVRVTTQNGEPCGLKKALHRELLVWMRGLAFGLPLFSLFAPLHQYSVLKKEGTTSWDKDLDLVVGYAKFGFLRVILSLAGVIFILMAYGFIVQQMRGV